MKRRNVIDIIERFQTRHALQEEHEMKNFNASTDGGSTQGVPDKDGMLKNGIFETQKSINTNEIQINGEKVKWTHVTASDSSISKELASINSSEALKNPTLARWWRRTIRPMLTSAERSECEPW